VRRLLAAACRGLVQVHISPKTWGVMHGEHRAELPLQPTKLGRPIQPAAQQKDQQISSLVGDFSGGRP